MSRIEVGATLYVIPIGANNTPRGKNILDFIQEVKVSKIGNKYFYIQSGDGKFNLETMESTSENHYDYRAYFSIQEIQDEVEIKRLENKFKNIFNAWGNTGLTLDQLKKIDNIIISNAHLR